jgi:hypothetical protein
MSSAGAKKLNKFNEIFSESANRLRTVPGAPNPFYLASKKSKHGDSPDQATQSVIDDEKLLEKTGS